MGLAVDKSGGSHHGAADENADTFPWVALLDLLKHGVPLGAPKRCHDLAALACYQIHTRLVVHCLLSGLQHMTHTGVSVL